MVLKKNPAFITYLCQKCLTTTFKGSLQNSILADISISESVPKIEYQSGSSINFIVFGYVTWPSQRLTGRQIIHTRLCLD